MSYQNFQMRQIWFVDVRNEIKIQSSHQGEVNAQTEPVTFHWKVLRLFVYEGMKWSGEWRVKVGGCGRSRNKLTGKYVKSQTHSIGWYYAPTPECFLNMHGLLMAPNGLSPQITFSWGTSCASQTALSRHSYDSRPVLNAVQTTQAVSTPRS